MHTADLGSSHGRKPLEYRPAIFQEVRVELTEMVWEPSTGDSEGVERPRQPYPHGWYVVSTRLPAGSHSPRLPDGMVCTSRSTTYMPCRSCHPRDHGRGCCHDGGRHAMVT